MKHSQNNIDVMTADEIVDALHNGTIETLQAKDVLRIIESIEGEAEENKQDYGSGYNDGLQEGWRDAIKDAIAALEDL